MYIVLTVCPDFLQDKPFSEDRERQRCLRRAVARVAELGTQLGGDYESVSLCCKLNCQHERIPEISLIIIHFFPL